MERRMRELVDKLNELAAAYYVYDAPKVSDGEYDALFDELLTLERETGNVLPDSPTLRVGGAPLEKFNQHRHIARLWSLDKVRSREELVQWSIRTNRLVEEWNMSHEGKLPPVTYSLEYKFDGLTVNLTYSGGVLVQAATRGNGTVGEEILPQIRTVRNIPLSIPFKGTMEVQGEGIMRLSVLDELNRSGDDVLKNARNAAAGALRNLDPQVTAKRKLDCFFYNVGYMDGASISNHVQSIEFLKENGIPTSPFMELYHDMDSVFARIEEIGKTKDRLDFLIDGMVIKICDYRTRQVLGATERFPRWAIAYKFPAEEVTTVLRNVTWEVGRTGKLTPRAHLDPVELAGATITHATLNNFDDIQRKRLGIGSRVFIRRSNEVIPEILGAVDGDTPERRIEEPEICPACGAHVEHRGVHLYCTNALSCRPQIAAALAHFASRDAMDIEGFSEKTAALLVDAVNLATVADLYDLTASELMTLDGFKDKKTANIISAIEASKKCTLGRFVYAIGIPNVGAKTARDLADAFGSLERLRHASYDELVEIDDVGDTVANSILDYFGDTSIASQIDRLLAHGVDPIHETTNVRDNPLTGKTVVVTGTMERMSRNEIEELIAKLGGKPSSSVSKKTHMVVAGPGAGSKLTKAGELGIQVLDEERFFALLEKYI